MEVILSLYDTVMKRVIEEATIKRFEWYSGEIEEENRKDYALFYHSAYMEYDPIKWESLGNRRQHGMCNFRIFVCSPAVHGSGSNEREQTRNAELDHLKRISRVYKKLHAYSGNPDDGVGCISRTESNVRIKYPGLLVDILFFAVHLVDDAAVRATVPMSDDVVDEIQTSNKLTDMTTRAKFVRNFSEFAGNSSGENTFLAAMKALKVTTLYLYDLNDVIETTGGYPVLAAFVIKARTYGITSIYGFRSSQNSLIGNVAMSNKNYNAAHPEAKINFSFEDEFWNYSLTGEDSNAMVTNLGLHNPGNVGNKEYQDADGNSIWRLWFPQQEAVFAHAKGAGLKSDFYMGHVRDQIENTPEATISDKLVTITDRILLHCYPEVPIIGNAEGFKYLKKRLGILGKAAIRQKKVISIVVIFLEEIGNYEAAYNSVVKYNNSTSYDGKTGIKLEGWIVF